MENSWKKNDASVSLAVLRNQSWQTSKIHIIGGFNKKKLIANVN